MIHSSVLKKNKTNIQEIICHYNILKQMFSNYQIVNHHLLKDLTEMGLWNDDMKNQLIANNGSIQVIIL